MKATITETYLMQNCNKAYYYPTAFRRVQISRGICTPEDRLDRFSRNAEATNWIEVTKKKLLVKTNFFFTIFLDRNLKVKNLN